MTNTTESTRLALALVAYLECALWSTGSYDEDGNSLGSLDDEYDSDDISPEAREESERDLRDFLEANEGDLEGMGPEQIGYDFWLTRNRHGAGFWDRGLGGRGDRLTAAAHIYGSVDLYVGDDGKLYV